MAEFSSKFLEFFDIVTEKNRYLFDVIGLALIIFSIFVGIVSFKYLSNKILVNIISALDILWVLGSFIIVIFGLFNLSKEGNILIAIVAVWIGFLAYKQMKHNQ